jgi:uncharacterized protein YecT (DUF1311 family)
VRIKSPIRYIHFALAITIYMQSPYAASHENDVESVFSRSYKECMQKSDGVTVAMLECKGQEISIQDQRLNYAYQKIFKKSSPKFKSLLRAAQRAWLKFKDAECEMRAAPENGATMGLLILSNCRLTATAKRANELESFLAQPYDVY